jgi:cytochrome d ubiquinol oxidase subunit I
MRTADGVSKHDVSSLALSLGLFIVVYLFVFGVGVAYVLRLVRKGPIPHEGDLPTEGGPGQDKQQMRPMSLPEESL